MTVQSSSPPTVLNKIRVLLAEDHHLVRKAFSTLLSAAPDIQEVKEVTQVSDLLDQVKKVRPHVFILNAKMPDGKVLFTSQGWRKQYPDVHILLISARRPHEVRLLGMEEALDRSVRLVAGRKEGMSRRVVDILTKAFEAREDDPQLNLSAREILV